MVDIVGSETILRNKVGPLFDPDQIGQSIHGPGGYLRLWIVDFWSGALWCHARAMGERTDRTREFFSRPLAYWNAAEIRLKAFVFSFSFFFLFISPPPPPPPRGSAQCHGLESGVQFHDLLHSLLHSLLACLPKLRLREGSPNKLRPAQ
ncbi:hypothetical protein P170DRAFT_238460 [Aspergillus steynii IBT 23096]|uniref:Uncharacterized protein n=1 Tax=Aspergillus steynii IBT 23096 TaxID=1392250 RepID=A0A2I2G380_9EURO|nr:uncharacterized protein P170DRAFT_238460 [Aspergillus steynii IBT 23096]PLB47307.1 hypothetical protein P170DRAFT_238460 [Aspergillus steynii IBT 23096]